MDAMERMTFNGKLKICFFYFHKKKFFFSVSLAYSNNLFIFDVHIKFDLEDGQDGWGRQ